MTERYSGEEKPEIALWFIPNRVPNGGAPDQIREQWVDVPLPVRSNHLLDPSDEVGGYGVGMNIKDPREIVVRTPRESVIVEAGDAFKSLRIAGRTMAADWWEEWFNERHLLMGKELGFHVSEGQIFTPAEVEAEHPHVNRFDEIVV